MGRHITFEGLQRQIKLACEEGRHIPKKWPKGFTRGIPKHQRKRPVKKDAFQVARTSEVDASGGARLETGSN